MIRECLVHEKCQFEADTLTNGKPMQSAKSNSDMVAIWNPKQSLAA